MSITDETLYLEIRTRDERLISQWAIPVGEDASEIDVNAEIAHLRSPYMAAPDYSWADAILAGDS